MTDREKAIVMAYTGAAMLVGDKFSIYHKYIEDICGRPIYVHEIAFLAEEIKEKSRADFIELCREETRAYDCISQMEIKALEQEPSREFEDYENEIEGLQNRLDIAEYDKERLREEVTNLEEKIKAIEQEPKTGHWIVVPGMNEQCSECGKFFPLSYFKDRPFEINYCPNCGAKMSEIPTGSESEGCGMSKSVLIVDTPKTCGDCPLCIYTAEEKKYAGYCNTSDDDYYCKALDRFMEYDKVDGGVDILGKPIDCPLQPEIIRCRDCREFRRYINTDITFCDRTEVEVKGDDFCSHAKKMEVEAQVRARK